MRSNDGDTFLDQISGEFKEAQAEDKYRETGFSDYLELIREDPKIVRNSYQRLFDMVRSYGKTTVEEGGEEVPRYEFFDDPFGGGEDAVYGINGSLKDFVDILEAAAKGLGPDRRIILLHGPVATSKSTIGRLLRKGLEEYSATEAGRLYTFEWDLEDMEEEPSNRAPCPIQEEPLKLIPENYRGEIISELNAKLDAPYELRVEGRLCPKCRYYFKKKMAKYDDDLSRVLEDVIVKRLIFSEQDRTGLATFEPKDKKNQDEEELTGGINWRLVQVYGSESDPRSFNYDGELCVANRGVFDGEELLKLQEEFLYDFLHATQEHVIKPKKNPRIDIDAVILGRTNNPEYEAMKDNEKMEAFNDRTRKVDIPYVVRVEDEESIYRKFFPEDWIGGKHIAPHTLEMAATWATLTRLEEPTGDISLFQKLRAYNGETIRNKDIDQKELQKETEDEAMFGISPRYVRDMISKTLVNDREGCINPYKVLSSLEDNLEHHSAVEEDKIEQYREYIELTRDRLAEISQDEVRRVISRDPEEITEVGNKYLDHLMAYLQGEKITDPYTGKEKEPDEDFLRDVEKQLEISEHRKKDFRQEVSNWISEKARHGESFDPQDNDRLRRALERKLWEDKKHNINFSAMVSDKSTDPSHQERKTEWIERLKEEYGYCDVCAENVIDHAGAEVAREEIGEEK